MSEDVVTDIGRDGTEQGVNIEGARVTARTIGLPMIASGGVATLEDVAKLRPLFDDEYRHGEPVPSW